MIFAAIGDVRGNLPALEAVLEDIDEMGIQVILNTGNCIVGRPWPEEVIDLLESHKILSVQGELDRMVIRFLRKTKRLKNSLTEQQFNTLEWTYNNTSSTRLEVLRALSKNKTLTLDGIEVYCCHGTPAGSGRSLYEEDDDFLFRRQRELAPAEIMIFGHTRQPFTKSIDTTLFVNPGSVDSLEPDDTSAHYAIIVAEEEPWSVEFRSIPYDHKLVEQACESKGLCLWDKSEER